jgi:hypothetical protein
MRLINSSSEILFYTTYVEADSAVESEFTEPERQVLEQHQAGYTIIQLVLVVH